MNTMYVTMRRAVFSVQDVSAAAVEQDSFCSVQGVSPCDTRDTPGHAVGDTNPPGETDCGARRLEVLDSSLFRSSSKAGPGPRQTEGHTVNIGQVRHHWFTIGSGSEFHLSRQRHVYSIRLAKFAT